MSSNQAVPNVEKKLRRQLHISGVNMLNECGVRYEFRYILGKKTPPSAFILTGHGTHKGVERNLDSVIRTEKMLERDAVQDIAAEHVAEEAKKEPIKLDEDEKDKSVERVIAEAKDKAVRLVTLHYDEAAPALKPKYTEKGFSVSLDKFLMERSKAVRQTARELAERDEKYAAKVLESQATALFNASREGWDFVGTWDIVEQFTTCDDDRDEINNEQTNGYFPPVGEALHIRDTKTKSKSPSEKEAADSEQLTGYAAAAKVYFGAYPDKLVLDCLVETKKKDGTPGSRSYVAAETTRDAADTEVFLNRVVNALHAIKTGIFVPTKPDDWRCSQKWCGYFDICPYAKKPKTVSLTKIAGAQ